jgi:hypothetical protein
MGDVSTLAEPRVVDDLVKLARGMPHRHIHKSNLPHHGEHSHHGKKH